MKPTLNNKLNALCTEVDRIKQSMPVNYIDSIIQWCEDNNVDLEFAAAAIKKDAKILSVIEIEAENLNFIKKKARLPIDFAV